MITAIGSGLTVTMIYNWSDWQWSTMLAVFFIIVLVVHVLEEWKFPGGFFYMYNIQHDSNIPDRYPMD